MADRVPRGNAHSYSADSYIDGWGGSFKHQKTGSQTDSKQLIKKFNKQ